MMLWDSNAVQIYASRVMQNEMEIQFNLGGELLGNGRGKPLGTQSHTPTLTPCKPYPSTQG
jgi:hypothetical protein